MTLVDWIFLYKICFLFRSRVLPVERYVYLKERRERVKNILCDVALVKDGYVNKEHIEKDFKESSESETGSALWCVMELTYVRDVVWDVH